jgi:hypothetical protein
VLVEYHHHQQQVPSLQPHPTAYTHEQDLKVGYTQHRLRC